MNNNALRIKSNTQLAANIFELSFEGDFCDILPGNFISLRLKDRYLRRPFSIADYSAGELRVVYKLVGKGTKSLSELKAGESVDALYPLGNSFTLCEKSDMPLIISGGLGLTPLFPLIRELLNNDIEPQIVCGWGSSEEAFYIDRIKNEFGIDPIVFTCDGSMGREGLVTDILSELEYGRIYSCGPEAMLRKIKTLSCSSAEFSLEARMGCSVGACMCCTIKTEAGPKSVCKDGPVFSAAELIFPLSGGIK